MSSSLGSSSLAVVHPVDEEPPSASHCGDCQLLQPRVWLLFPSSASLRNSRSGHWLQSTPTQQPKLARLAWGQTATTSPDQGVCGGHQSPTLIEGLLIGHAWACLQQGTGLDSLDETFLPSIARRALS